MIVTVSFAWDPSPLGARVSRVTVASRLGFTSSAIRKKVRDCYTPLEYNVYTGDRVHKRALLVIFSSYRTMGL